MSKNKYIFPLKNTWFIEYGGINKKKSHSWDIENQRYAYDLEIRFKTLPYIGDYHNLNNYFSYMEEVMAPLDGFVFDIVDKYKDTLIYDKRKRHCDVDDVHGNYIIIKHKHGEYSVICHLLKGSFKVKLGDVVKQGEVIALVGNSGNTEGPHVHFQVQDGPSFNSSKGVKISFKNAYISKDNKNFLKTRYIGSNYYVKGKGKYYE